MKNNKPSSLILLFCLFATFALAQKPKATIISPVNGSFYTGSQKIIFKGSGFDSKDGNMNASSFRWLVFMNHGKGIAQHWHDGIGLYDGISEGTFNTPLSDEHVIGDSIFYRFYLIVKNSKGISDTAYVDVIPKQTKLTIETEPKGLKLNIQGNGILVTPIVAFPTQDMLLSISALESQVFNGITYNFKEWSDGNTSPDIYFTIPEKTISVKAIYTATTAINNKLDNAIFKIYPNPANDVIHVEASIEYISNSNVQIFNISGKIIDSNFNTYNNGSNKISIDTEKFSQGFYILKINTERGYTLYPFSKQ